MKIEIKFLNDNDEVLLRGGSTTGDILRAEGELESMAQNWHKMLASGEVCELCENTGWREEGEFDDIKRVECKHEEDETTQDD